MFSDVDKDVYFFLLHRERKKQEVTNSKKERVECPTELSMFRREKGARNCKGIGFC